MKKRLSTIITIFIFIMASCTKEVYVPPLYNCNTTVSYQTDIKPIVESNCVGCHFSGFSSGDFTSFEGFKAKADQGRVEAMVFTEKKMPPNGPIPDEDLELLYCWLQDGALEN
jgi:hypothetical protein